MTFCEPHSSAILDAAQGNMGLEGVVWLSFNDTLLFKSWEGIVVWK